MAEGKKTGGRQKGTPNKNTSERGQVLRELLRGIGELCAQKITETLNSKDCNLTNKELIDLLKIAAPLLISRPKPEEKEEAEPKQLVLKFEGASPDDLERLLAQIDKKSEKEEGEW
jgi:hypothetical protein